METSFKTILPRHDIDAGGINDRWRPASSRQHDWLIVDRLARQPDSVKQEREARIAALARWVAENDRPCKLFAAVKPNSKNAVKIKCKRCGKSLWARKTGNPPRLRKSYCSRECQYAAGVEIRLKGKKRSCNRFPIFLAADHEPARISLHGFSNPCSLPRQEGGRP